MRVTKKGVGMAIGSTVALCTIMAAPVYADTTSAIVTKEESILDTAAWQDMAAANVKTYANVRADKTIESDRVGVLLPGHAAEIVKQEGEWSKIKSGNVEGYIRNDLLVFGEEARVHYMNVCGITATVDATGLRVRAEASIESQIKGVLEDGSKIQVTGETDDWYQVIYKGSEAYVSAQYLELNDLDSLALTLEEYREQINAKKQSARTAAVQTASYSNTLTTSEMDLLAAIIQCEAGGESRTGKVAVGAVVLNRVRSASFPNTISEVVYQSGQFSPVRNGSLSRTLANGARSDCYEAAQAALNGENPVGGCLYFNSGKGKGIQIGNQHFY